MIEEVESSHLAFLWLGSDLNTRRAKMSWIQVCFPFEEGGLGIRNTGEFYFAAMLKICGTYVLMVTIPYGLIG